jgi:serine/threonine-protein kinase
MVGETLAGRYRVDAALGAGATAVVYRAKDLRLERDVAVKVLLPNLARDPLVSGRFDREARALAAAGHPGIVSVYDVDRGDAASGREPFFVMELCDGGSLADALDDAGGRLSPETVVPMLATIAGGLASLHARGVIHRDIKPHNILVCGGRAKLADFGLARAQDTTRLTAAGTGAGTLAYLAPELLGGEEPGPAADVYGLGVVTFQALTGRLPRPSGSMVDLVDTRLAPIAPVSSVAPDLGPAFDSVVGAALSPDPARRPPPMAFAAGLGQALQRWRAQRPAGVARLPLGRPEDTTQHVRVMREAPPARFANSGRRSRASFFGPVIAAAALGVLAAIVILVVLQAGAGGPGPTASQRTTARPTASVTASPTPSQTPSPTLSPSPIPSPTPLPTDSPPPTPSAVPATPVPTVPPTWYPAQAEGQWQNVYRAIDNAEARFLITTKAAQDLRKLNDAAGHRLADRDQKGTALAVQKLSDKVAEMLGDGRLTEGTEIPREVDKFAQLVGPVR